MNFGPLFWSEFLRGIVGFAMFMISGLLFAGMVLNWRWGVPEWPPVRWIMNGRSTITALMVIGAIARFVINNHPWWGLLQVLTYAFCVYLYLPWERRWSVKYRKSFVSL